MDTQGKAAGCHTLKPANRSKIVSPRAGVNNRTAPSVRNNSHFTGESAMKKSRPLILVAIALAALAAMVVAQGNKPASPPGEATLKFDDGKTVTIEYSRPSMRGRKIFGGLVPYDEVWRTGANAATSLKTDVALAIGGANVPAGSYTLYTLPGATSWKLIINKQAGQWGTEYNRSQDLARVDMKVSQRSSPIEEFTISFEKTGGNSAALKLEWDTTVASVNVQEKK
jgi:Protein of unknown function (DUF2911)